MDLDRRRRYVVLVQLIVGCSGAFGELLNWPVKKHEEDNIRHFSGDKMTRRVTRYLTPSCTFDSFSSRLVRRATR